MTKHSEKDSLQLTSPETYDIELTSNNLVSAKNLFLTNGFVVLRKCIPVQLVSALHKKILRIIQDGGITNTTRDIHHFQNGEVSSAHNLIDYLPEYDQLQNLGTINQLLTFIYGDISPEKFNSSYFAKPKEVGLETKPHQDNAFFCMDPAEIVTCWTPVTFADKRNGCLYYLPGSHKLGNISHVPEGNLGASMCIDKFTFDKINSKIPKQYIELHVGDCVMHNALVIHGSESNKSNFDRNAFNFSIASKRAIRNITLHNEYKDKLTTFLEAKKMMCTHIN